jgi:starch phosphorylase
MLTQYKARYNYLHRIAAAVIISAFLWTNTAFALAPKLALTQREFEEEYLTRTVLLTEASASQYIKANIRRGLQRHDGAVLVKGVSAILRNIGQIAKIEIDEEAGAPVICVDTAYFYNETVIGFEKAKIEALEYLRRSKGFDYGRMAAWLVEYRDKRDAGIGMTSRQWADAINAKAEREHPGIKRLYDRIKAKYVKAVLLGQPDRAASLLNFASIYSFYRSAGGITDREDRAINLAAHEDDDARTAGTAQPGGAAASATAATPRNATDSPVAAEALQGSVATSAASVTVPPEISPAAACTDTAQQAAIAELQALAKSLVPRAAGEKTRIQQNVPELAGKTILSISLEGNIPEFAAWPRIQNANFKGGLGAHYGDKFEGFDDIGMDAAGIQPGYLFDNNGEYIDYQELVNAGVLEEVRLPQPVEVWTWIREDGILNNLINGTVRIAGEDREGFFREWCSRQADGNALLKVKFYRIVRNGARRYIAVSPVWDRLYTEDGNHRFSQEVVFGKAVYAYCKATGFAPDILHVNEGHAVVAASEMRTDPFFDRTVISVTDHTPVEAGHQMFDRGDINRITYVLGQGGARFREKFVRLRRGRWIVDFSDAVIELADIRNGVSREHASVTTRLFAGILREKFGVDTGIEIIPVLNGSGDVWVNEELLAFMRAGRIPTEDELYEINERAKNDRALREVEARTGVKLDASRPTDWFVRRIVEYKSQYPMLRFIVHVMCADREEVFTREKLMQIWKRDILTHLVSGSETDMGREAGFFYYQNLERHLPLILDGIFAGRSEIRGLGMQIVVGGPEYERHWVNEFRRWMQLPALKGRFVYVPDSDTTLLKMQAIGSDICTNNPRDFDEAAGTSDQRRARNGGVTISENGAGPVEWVTDYDADKRDGSGFLAGPFLWRGPNQELMPDWDRFYSEGPGAFLRRTEAAADIFYRKDAEGRPDKSEWKRLMHNAYCASNYGAYIDRQGRLVVKKAVTARAMEERYARDVYAAGLRKGPDMTALLKGKGTVADLLKTIKNDERLFSRAIDSVNGLEMKGVVQAEVLDLLEFLGVLVPVKPGSANYCFGDVMRNRANDPDFTKTLINALEGLDYSLGAADLAILARMTITGELEKEFVTPEGKTMYHIIEQDVIPIAQRASLVQAVNNTFYTNSKGPERIIILKENQALADAIAQIRANDAGAIIDVALSDESHIGSVSDANIKKMVFKTESDFIDLLGVVKALRALYNDDAQAVQAALSQLYTVMAGLPPEGHMAVNNGVYVFNLPKISKENINDIPKLNKALLELLASA